jgi:hypothetical protein
MVAALERCEGGCGWPITEGEHLFVSKGPIKGSGRLLSFEKELCSDTTEPGKKSFMRE